MNKPQDKLEGAVAEGPVDSEVSGDDRRLPYERPRIVKQRSVARTTLFTAMGPAMTGTTMMPG